MKLVHYSATPIGELRVIEQDGDHFKPRGLWVSDDDCERNWRAWCEGEDFGLDRLTHAYDVQLVPGANVLMLRCADDIDTFSREWAVHPIPELRSNMFINWEGVRGLYAGLIATPYIWERRLTYGANDAMWYYSWDCASGCIWDPAAIQSIRLRGRDDRRSRND